MDIQYSKTLIDVILGYLQGETIGLVPGYFKSFFYGDPLVIPSSLLPCVSVEKISTDIKAGPIQSDEIDTLVAIKLMYNKKDDFGKTANEVLGVRALEEYAEAIDKTTNQYSPNSVMGILRKYFTLANPDNSYNVLDQKVKIKYGIVPRPSGNMTAEAQIEVTFHQLRKVVGRQ